MSQDKSGSEAPPKSGYSHVAKTVVQQTTLRVKEMHGAIANRPFSLLQRAPFITAPVAVVKATHDGISAGVYSAIHLITEGVCTMASAVESRLPIRAPEQPVSRLASGVHSALNGAFGDHLAASDSRLAIDMALRLDGLSIAPTEDALYAAFPHAERKICLFIHGLGCDEFCWQADPMNAQQVNFAQSLSASLGYTPLFLRYNTGLPIAENGRQLAVLLEQLLRHWPLPKAQLTLIGHSMGGLVARTACEQADEAGLLWPSATRMLISLGSPHLGSPVERLGHLTTQLLNLSAVTAPLGKITGSRSQGIQDLRHGLGAAKGAPGQSHIAYRFIGSSLAKDDNHPLGKVFGDGLVSLVSATQHGIAGDAQAVRFGSAGHMALLTDPRVYQQIVEWLQAQP